MRSIADFSVYDFVATLTIGSVLSSTLILSEVTLLNGFLAILIFLALQFIVSKLTTHFPILHHMINPRPKVVFFKGEFRDEALKTARVNKEEIYAAIRRDANTTSDQVDAVILETNGSFSVVTDISEGYEDEITRHMETDKAKPWSTK